MVLLGPGQLFSVRPDVRYDGHPFSHPFTKLDFSRACSHLKADKVLSVPFLQLDARFDECPFNFRSIKLSTFKIY
jgi:hypothetical protein